MSGPPTTVVEVFADVTCPFTHVGLRHLVDVRAERDRLDVHLRVRAWPLEVVNGQALDAGFVAEEVDEIRDQVAPELFAGFTVAAFPTTSLPALALAAAADRCDVGTGEQISLALRDLLFEQGVDIADVNVLRAIAADHGIPFDPADHLSVLADHAEGVERGVVGSPHFFTPAGGFFCPSLDVQRGPDGHLRITSDMAGFEAFAASCFP